MIYLCVGAAVYWIVTCAVTFACAKATRDKGRDIFWYNWVALILFWPLILAYILVFHKQAPTPK